MTKLYLGTCFFVDKYAGKRIFLRIAWAADTTEARRKFEQELDNVNRIHGARPSTELVITEAL